ncbi:MAG: helix-turn-helix domain-containing protein, partial [Eubacteriales bacterium]|nr:helix-turn-helix domain-containing protein [Eubacteriales bacterium]
MDFTELAREYMEVLFKMRKRKNDKKINDSMHGEQFVLTYVSKHGGSVIPSEISNEMGISTARIAAALNNLENKGLVTRRIDERDRRRILVELTAAGRA